MLSFEFVAINHRLSSTTGTHMGMDSSFGSTHATTPKFNFHSYIIHGVN